MIDKVEALARRLTPEYPFTFAEVLVACRMAKGDEVLARQTLEFWLFLGCHVIEER